MNLESSTQTKQVSDYEPNEKVNLQCRGVLLIWIIVGQGPTTLAVRAGGGCLDILVSHLSFPISAGVGRVVRRCWVNLQCRGVLLIWIIVRQWPVALALGTGGGGLDIFLSHLSFLSSFSPSLGDGPI